MSSAFYLSTLESPESVIPTFAPLFLQDDDDDIIAELVDLPEALVEDQIAKIAPERTQDVCFRERLSWARERRRKYGLAILI